MAPTRTVRAVVEATVEGTVTGTKEVPDGVARGRIRIVNATLEAFSIVAGREIQGSNGIVYRVTETVYVPAADPFGSQSFGVADVPVEATVIGPEGNAEPGVVSGQLADGVLFRNIEPISG
ncbi:MAG: baseplate J/gp47 family protein, partial [Thermomicrobium sp.]|nr:baseplate J/gp47 family protein [Thermomicrobium sp.]